MQRNIQKFYKNDKKWDEILCWIAETMDMQKYLNWHIQVKINLKARPISKSDSVLVIECDPVVSSNDKVLRKYAWNLNYNTIKNDAKKMTFEIFFFRQKNPIKICIWEILIHFKAIIYLNYFVWKLFVYLIVAYGIHTYTHTHANGRRFWKFIYLLSLKENVNRKFFSWKF